MRIQWNPLYYRHHWDQNSCPDYIVRCPYVRGVLMLGVPLYSGVSLCQGCPYVRGVPMSGVSLCQGCPYVRGVLMLGVSLCQGCPYVRGAII